VATTNVSTKNHTPSEWKLTGVGEATVETGEAQVQTNILHIIQLKRQNYVYRLLDLNGIHT
jgi:hypothetical protein